MPHSPAVHQAAAGRARTAWILLIAVLAAETAAGILALMPLATGFFEADDELLGQRVSVLLAGLLAVLWVAVTFLGALRARAGWARGSALTLHVLMFAAGTAMLQYALAPAWMTWAVILLAFAGFFAALLARPTAQIASADESSTGEIPSTGEIRSAE